MINCVSSNSRGAGFAITPLKTGTGEELDPNPLGDFGCSGPQQQQQQHQSSALANTRIAATAAAAASDCLDTTIKRKRSHGSDEYDYM